MSTVNYSTILTESNGSNLRHIANRHEFVTWSGAGQVGTAPLSNVFAASNFASTMNITGGSIYMNGPIYDYSSNALWVPGSTLSWQKTLTQAALVVPTGGVFTYTASNAIYRYIGNEVIYNVNLTGTVTTQPTAGAAADYTLTVPQPVNTTTYTTGTIIGELWLTVTSASLSNTFKAFARANVNSNVATLRVLSGTSETTLGSITAGNSINLQGTLTYTTPLVNNANGLPITYTPAAFVQNQLGSVSLGSSQAPRGEFDVVGNAANTPVLVVDQQSTGDAVRVLKSGVSKVVVDGNGNVGIGTTLPLSPLHVIGDAIVSGGIASNKFSVISLANNLAAVAVTNGTAHTINTSYTVNGGTVILFANFSGYSTATGAKAFTLQYSIDNGTSYTTIGTRNIYYNIINYHFATGATFVWSPGSITVTNWRVTNTGSSDTGDYLHLVALQLPF